MRKTSLAAITLLCLFAQLSFADSARTGIATIEKHFLEGNYNAVISESSALIDSGRGKKDELYYLKGLSELKSNKFSAARDSFNYIISKCSWSKKVFDAHLGIGDSYMLEGNNPKALSAYNDMVIKYDKDKNISIVYGRLSLCRSNQQNQIKRSPNPTSAEKGRISVQVGSFKDKRNADKLAKKLAARGYESHVSIPVSSDDNYYRVKVGSFNSKPEAQKLESKLRSDGYRTKVCTDNVCE